MRGGQQLATHCVIEPGEMSADGVTKKKKEWSVLALVCPHIKILTEWRGRVEGWRDRGGGFACFSLNNTGVREGNWLDRHLLHKHTLSASCFNVFPPRIFLDLDLERCLRW